MSEWISIKERLPEESEYGKVLVTFIPSAGALWKTVIIAHYSDLMGIAKPSFHIGEVGKSDFRNITEQVTAWMPLPKPYKEDTKPKNPIGQTMDFLKNLYLNNKEEIDRVAQEYKVIEPDREAQDEE